MDTIELHRAFVESQPALFLQNVNGFRESECKISQHEMALSDREGERIMRHEQSESYLLMQSVKLTKDLAQSDAYILELMLTLISRAKQPFIIVLPICQYSLRGFQHAPLQLRRDDAIDDSTMDPVTSDDLERRRRALFTLISRPRIPPKHINGTAQQSDPDISSFASCCAAELFRVSCRRGVTWREPRLRMSDSVLVDLLYLSA